MKYLIQIVSIVGLLLTFTAANAFADVRKDEELAMTIESLAIPESPAFSVLGVTPDKIIRPGNGRELTIVLLQGMDEKGNLQNGLALDFAPYLAFFGNELSLDKYRASPFAQFMSHIQLSLGVSKGAAGDDKSARVAAGIRTTVFDFGDSRMDTILDACIGEAQTRALNRLPPLPPNHTETELAERVKAIEQYTEEELKVCRDAHAELSLGKPALDIGFSPLWVSEDGQTKNLAWSGVAAWSSFKIGSGDLLVIANIQYKSKDREPDSARTGQFIEGQSLSAGAKARYGSASFGLLAQAVYKNFALEDDKKDNQFLYSVGVEIKLADNFWLQASVGGTSGKEGTDSGFVSGQFKWGLSETSVLK